MHLACSAYPTLQDFWTAVSAQVKSCNYPTYHPCCKVWTSRYQTVLRKSHSASLTWGQVLREAGCSQTEPLDLLRAHMMENGWGPPIYLNAKCRLARPPSWANQPHGTVQSQPDPHPTSGAFFVHQSSPMPPSTQFSPAQRQSLPNPVQIPLQDYQIEPEATFSQHSSAQYVATSPRLEKRFDLLEAKLNAVSETLAEHMKNMNQRVGNLPASFQAVHNNLAKCTTQQDHLSRNLQRLGADHSVTQKNVGHVHELVSNIYTQNKDNNKLAEGTKTLASMLEEMKLERRESQSLLEDSEARVEELENEKALLLQEVDKLRAEISAMRVKEGERALAESLKNQRYAQSGLPSYQFASAIEYSIKKKY